MQRQGPWSARATTILVLAALATATLGRAQESAHYVADRTTLAAVAGRATSAGYLLELTAGEIGPVGSASFCNVGFTDSTGFWSVLGDSQVPIFLEVSHDGLDPSIARLDWTGSSPMFEVLRSALASDVRDPLNLLTTTAGCDTPDPDLPAPHIFYYLVIPAGSLEAAP